MSLAPPAPSAAAARYGRGSGSMRSTRSRSFLNAAQNFSRRHAPSLQSFLHWLTASDSEIKREFDNGKEGGEGQVRIMTVHAAKGLEAPIVFLPDTAEMPRVQDVPKFLWDDAMACPFISRINRTRARCGIYGTPRAARQLEEYRRLLYVAMTRASHRLYIGGWELARRKPIAMPAGTI